MKEKICPGCTTPKLLSEFSWRDKAHTKRCSWCKECVNKARIASYHRNPEPNRESQLRAVARNKAYVITYFSDHPCTVCGEPDHVVLDFHHLRDKKLEISRMVTDGYGVKSIAAEIKKCQVVCSNCHRRLHNAARVANSKVKEIVSMQVVINKCFGGWTLSVEAVIWLAENRPDSPYWSKSSASAWICGQRDLTLAAVPGTMWSTVDGMGTIITHDGETIWSENFCNYYPPSQGATPEQQAIGVYSGRSSEELLACIKELGLEAVTGPVSQLEVVTIPDGIKWDIDDYDGIESIHEQHRSW